MNKISVTNIDFYCKNYLILTQNFREVVCNFEKNLRVLLKNKEKKVYSTFVTVTLSLLSSLSTVHSIKSPGLRFNICAIGAGSVVLTELLFVLALLIFVFCLNITTILRYIMFCYTYIYNIRYIKLIIIYLIKIGTFI